MSFEALNTVIQQLKQTHWKEQQAFQRLVDDWREVVGPTVSAQTTPLNVTPKRVLQVAASSGAWAHNLSFERQALLKKINQRYKLGLVDIFFTTSQWGRSPIRAFQPQQAEGTDLSQIRTRTRKPKPRPENSQEAFERWVDAVQARSRRLEVCPECECPTPKAELDRWDMCSLCVARQQLDREAAIRHGVVDLEE